MLKSLEPNLPPIHRRSGDPIQIMEIFEAQIYSVLTKECKPVKQQKQPPKKLYPSRMVQKLLDGNAILEGTLEYSKRDGRDSLDAQREYFQVMRSYHKIQRATSKNQSTNKSVWEKKRFIQDPNAFAHNLFNPPHAGVPTFTKDIAEAYFTDICRDDDRSYEYQAPDVLPRPSPPMTAFNMEFPSFDQFSKICWRKRNKSAPGCNGISYQVYKCCPKIRTILWEILNRIWLCQQIPSVWKVARIRLIYSQIY